MVNHWARVPGHVLTPCPPPGFFSTLFVRSKNTILQQTLGMPFTLCTFHCVWFPCLCWWPHCVSSEIRCLPGALPQADLLSASLINQFLMGIITRSLHEKGDLSFVHLQLAQEFGLAPVNTFFSGLNRNDFKTFVNLTFGHSILELTQALQIKQREWLRWKSEHCPNPPILLPAQVRLPVPLLLLRCPAVAEGVSHHLVRRSNSLLGLNLHPFGGFTGLCPEWATSHSAMVKGVVAV